MDLISREEVRRLIWRNNDKYGYSDRFHEFTDEVLNNLPSAFEGMTVGEVLKAVLGIEDEQIVEAKYLVSIEPKRNHHDPFIAVKRDVWDSPYKGG